MSDVESSPSLDERTVLEPGRPKVRTELLYKPPQSPAQRPATGGWLKNCRQATCCLFLCRLDRTSTDDHFGSTRGSATPTPPLASPLLREASETSRRTVVAPAVPT